MRKIVDGNKAASEIAYLFSEVSTIYPITPSSPMASNVDDLANGDNYNLFNGKVKVVEMESEAGAAGAMHGSLLAGSLTSTFTASQGLLLMIPNMYKMAGECLPGVIHVASRTIATHALSIFGDHSDIYAVRPTGFCILASTNVEDAYNLAAVAHLSAIEGSLPFVHFFDGFRISHETNVINTIDNNKLLELVNKDALKDFKNRSLNLGDMKQYGMAENEDIYFQSVEARGSMYDKMPDIVNNYMQKINKLTGKNYKPFNYYGSSSAKNIIVAMGSVCDTIKQVIDNESNDDLGLIEVHLYRPFSIRYLLDILPNTTKNIAVLDRTKESGSIGEPLYLDIVSALKDKDINIVGGRYGLSSKNTTPAQIKAVYDMLNTDLKNNFTIGITDDMNHSSLDIDDTYSLNTNSYEIKIYGFGSDGMVSASKDILHILGESKYVQGYNEYDSKKSGGVTISHLRIGTSYINAPYYIEHANLVVVTKDEYFNKYDILSSIKENGILLINTKDENKLLEKLSKEDLDIINNKNITILTIDALDIASRNHLKNKISRIMEVIILKLLGEKDPVSILNENIYNDFIIKGEDIVNNNKNAISEALMEVKKITIASDIDLKSKEIPKDVIDKINRRLGDTLTVSELSNFKNGCFPGNLTKNEKRNISELVPIWNSDNCIQCGMCSLICPHAVIRPFLVDDNGIDAIGEDNKKYIIKVSERDCQGCNLCVDICPGKNGIKALTMGKPTYDDEDDTNNLFENHINESKMNKFTIKGSQYIKPKFEFSGACAGCGEAAYIKLLTQLYGDNIIIANATGCSSIYGGSVPSTPYSLPWANSLFEDNAEFAYGMHLSYATKRERLRDLIIKDLDNNDEHIKTIYQEFLDNYNNFDKTKEIKNELSKLNIPKEIADLLDYVEARTVVALGGDGWAYDIGFNGIDHVLSSNENIKIMVLDTEVYSNTGGQMSKSSRVGQVSQFASSGKTKTKKDLFRIAMSYPNTYVASICLGSNPMQAIKSMKEAMEHDGPAIIICYSPCIEHGIKGGMSCSLNQEKLAVESGYVLLMRYNPNDEKLILDSKEPNFDKYDNFLSNEVRYSSLKLKNKNDADNLLKINKDNAIKRYEYYRNMINE